MATRSIPEPWSTFLMEIDDSLESEVSFHCLGGFAITMLYDLPRETSDVDIMAVAVKADYDRLTKTAGKESLLHNKHKVYLDLVGAVANVPDDYEDRLIKIDSPLKKIQLYVMEPHDIVLSKLGRNAPKDVQDVMYLANVGHLNTDLLEARYEKELRHNMIGPIERADGTIRYWIRIINELRSSDKILHHADPTHTSQS